MKKSLLLLLFIISTTATSLTYGQVDCDSQKLIKIEMKDGNIFIGSLIAEDQNYIFLATGNLGELRISYRSIVKEQKFLNS